MTEFTLKLDFFGYIRDIIDQIFVNDTLIERFEFCDMFAFLRNFIMIYVNVLNEGTAIFVQLNPILRKIYNLKVIINAFRAILRDQRFIINENDESLSIITNASKNSIKGKKLRSQFDKLK